MIDIISIIYKIIRPIGERVLIKPIKKEEKTKSGILLSSKSSNTDTQNQAEVIALGKGEKLEGIKVGDKVIFNRFSGNEIEDGEEKYLVVNAEDILAVIE